MDIREVKTRRSIHNAFLEIRSKKPLEKITVKELSEKAEISKATFYLHYHDIYDLSEQLQKDFISTIIDLVPDPDAFLDDMVGAHKVLNSAIISNISIIDILFSGSQRSVLSVLVEGEIKKAIFEKHPEFENDAAVNTKLSFLIMGSFYAYLHNSSIFPSDKVNQTILEMLERINKAVEE